jgi:hypothetical protein
VQENQRRVIALGGTESLILEFAAIDVEKAV